MERPTLGVVPVEVAEQTVDPLSVPLLMLPVHRWMIRSRESPRNEGRT